jgi:hypothetical protein
MTNLTLGILRKDHPGSLDKVFRPLLHGDAAEEGNYLVIICPLRDVKLGVMQRFNGVVNRYRPSQGRCCIC